MTAPDLDAIEARSAAATVGPWRVKNKTEVWTTLPEDPNRLRMYRSEQYVDIGGGSSGEGGGYAMEPADAEFIAHARTDVPALIAEVRRLRERPTADEVAGRIESFLKEIDVLAAARATLALLPDVDGGVAS